MPSFLITLLLRKLIISKIIFRACNLKTQNFFAKNFVSSLNISCNELSYLLLWAIKNEVYITSIISMIVSEPIKVIYPMKRLVFIYYKKSSMQSLIFPWRNEISLAHCLEVEFYASVVASSSDTVKIINFRV